MKKIAWSLVFVSVLTMASTGLSSVAYADNPFGNTYKWGTNGATLDYINPVMTGTPTTGWPFDDGHFVAEFFGNQSPTYTNQRYLQHYHVIVTQKENQYGDYFYLRYVQAYDRPSNTTYGPFYGNDGEQMTNLGTHAGTNGSAWVTKQNNSVRFYLTDYMRSSTGSIQTAMGTKYRTDF